MDCGTALVKYILFAFNAIVSVIGVVAIVYGVINLEILHAVQVNEAYQIRAITSIGLIVIGSFVVLISLCGCCGAIQENVCKIMCYGTFMFILLSIQLVAVVLLWVNHDSINGVMGNIVEVAWKEREEGRPDKLDIFDSMQKTLKCCGVNGPLDYIKQLETIPNSCCEHSPCIISDYPGCRQKLIDVVTGNVNTARYFGLGLIAVEFVGFVFSCCLANNLRNYKHRNIGNF